MWIIPDPVPDEENAWGLLEEIYESVSRDDRYEVSRWAQNPEENVNDRNTWLQKTQIIQKFQVILPYQHCRPPFALYNENERAYTEILIFAHQLLRLNLYATQSNDERYEAWKLYLDLLKKWENPKTGFHSPQSRRQTTNDMLEDLTHDPLLLGFSVEKLNTLLKMCEMQDADLSDDWMWALLLNYQYQHRTFAEGGWEGYWEEFYGRTGQPVPRFARWYVFPFVYQPNRTQALILESYQAPLSQVAPERFDFPRARDFEQIKKDDFTHEGIGVVLYAVNLYGTALFCELAAPYFRNIEHHTAENSWNLLAIQLYLRLLLHEQTHGSLPEYLPENPLDPFDGKPIRYQPELRIFYSVGWNGTDEGGLDEGRSRSGDIVVELPELK